MPALLDFLLDRPAIHKGVKSLTLNVPLWEISTWAEKCMYSGNPGDKSPNPFAQSYSH